MVRKLLHTRCRVRTRNRKGSERIYVRGLYPYFLLPLLEGARRVLPAFPAGLDLIDPLLLLLLFDIFVFRDCIEQGLYDPRERFEPFEPLDRLGYTGLVVSTLKAAATF